METTQLARTIRDNTGKYHLRGETIQILGHWMELGTHRDLLRAEFSDGSKTILLPEDVQE